MSTCWNFSLIKRAEEQGYLPQSFGHDPCGYGSGARLAGRERLTQQPEDDLPRGASHHLDATALAQAHHKGALEVSGWWLDLASS